MVGLTRNRLCGSVFAPHLHCDSSNVHQGYPWRKPRVATLSRQANHPGKSVHAIPFHYTLSRAATRLSTSRDLEASSVSQSFFFPTPVENVQVESRFPKSQELTDGLLAGRPRSQPAGSAKANRSASPRFHHGNKKGPRKTVGQRSIGGVEINGGVLKSSARKSRVLIQFGNGKRREDACAPATTGGEFGRRQVERSTATESSPREKYLEFLNVFFLTQSLTCHSCDKTC